MLNIEGYELLEEAGRGGMAVVWKARQLSLDRIVAIKILGRSSLPDQEARDRFRKEAQAAAKLNHPGIVQVYDTGEVGDSAYLVMEYVEGHTVGDLILQQVALSEPRALEIIEHVARALAYAWEKECLIHCDIKPDNILIDRASGVVKVADLGLARMIGFRAHHADDELIIGTPNYVSPEQAAGLADLDCRADIYSLGATLYHMVTGVLPFRGSAGSAAMNRHATDFLEDPLVINPALSQGVAWLIEKWMIKNRALRAHFWTQVIKDIEAVRQGRMPHPPWPEEGASTVKRSPARTTVKPARITHSGAVKTAGEPRKLTVRKSELTPLSTGNNRERSSSGSFVGWVVFLLVLSAAVYGALLYFGKVPWPSLWEPYRPRPAAEHPREAEDDADAWAEEAPRKPESGTWRNEDFIQGARLFNQALADYKEYQQTRSNPEMLKTIEENCREAIALFEAAREFTPAHIPIGQYIDQCNGLIFNVRQSTTLDMEDDTPPSGPSVADGPPPADRPRNNITFIEEEQSAEAVIEAAPEASRLLRVSFGPGWDRPELDPGGVSQELKRLMARDDIKPSRELMVEASVVLYPGITCMMSAREAARVLHKELPVRRLLSTPAWPAQSLFYYQFEGEFSGARQLTLVVDQNGRVVALQLYDDRSTPSRMENLLSPNWHYYNLVEGLRRGESDGQIAHRVRIYGSLLVIDTERAAPEVSGGGRLAASRARLMMPVQMAEIIKHLVK